MKEKEIKRACHNLSELIALRASGAVILEGEIVLARRRLHQLLRPGRPRLGHNAGTVSLSETGSRCKSSQVSDLPIVVI